MMEKEINDKIEKNSAVREGKKELPESEVVDALEDLCAAALRTFKTSVKILVCFKFGEF